MPSKQTSTPLGVPRVSFAVKKGEAEIIGKIRDRFVKMRAAFNMRTTKDEEREILMDLMACHANGSPLNLETLLASDERDFSHDVALVVNNVDRRTGKMPGWFHPRCNR